MNSVISFFIAGLLVIFCSWGVANTENSKMTAKADTYQCLPCGSDCDKRVFNASGNCPSCHMKLVKTTSVGFASIQPSAICQYIKDHPNTVLLDVRTKREFEGKADPDFGSLKNAINIPIQELEARLSELSLFKTKEIIVYCSHSHRSPQASYLLTQNGFTKVVNMDGGMSRLGSGDCVESD